MSSELLPSMQRDKVLSVLPLNRFGVDILHVSLLLLQVLRYNFILIIFQYVDKGNSKDIFKFSSSISKNI